MALRPEFQFITANPLYRIPKKQLFSKEGIHICHSSIVKRTNVEGTISNIDFDRKLREFGDDIVTTPTLFHDPIERYKLKQKEKSEAMRGLTKLEQRTFMRK